MPARRKRAVVTGASARIGRELARVCAAEEHDLVLCADEPELEQVARELRDRDILVETVRADLATK